MEKIKIVLITGFSGLVGNKSSLFYFKISNNTIVIENNMCKYFFDNQAEINCNRITLENIFFDNLKYAIIT
tara:strand:- start:439 stop:651 length:213 start_codon:yes stop_codon:yes gene_type:complete